ncbi:Glucosamine-6-phosphate deaminase [Dirofilaria immitis]
MSRTAFTAASSVLILQRVDKNGSLSSGQPFSMLCRQIHLFNCPHFCIQINCPFIDRFENIPLSISRLLSEPSKIGVNYQNDMD